MYAYRDWAYANTVPVDIGGINVPYNRSRAHDSRLSTGEARLEARVRVYSALYTHLREHALLERILIRLSNIRPISRDVVHCGLNLLVSRDFPHLVQPKI